LKDGWSDVESDGIWSVGVRSRMAFRLDNPTKDVVIRLTVGAFAPRGFVRTFDVLANGRRVAAWTFAVGGPAEKTIRLSLPSPKRHFIIQFRSNAPKSPFELGVSGDRRKLGLYLSSLRIDVGADGRSLGAAGITSHLRSVTRLWRWRSARLLQRVMRLWPGERA
jgi:hypothetical protein